MLLTLTARGPDARDLGRVLHKHPDRVNEVELSFGRATVFFPRATDEEATAALLVEIDPVALVRGRRGGDGLLDQYVNDRPYAASSFLSVAVGQCFRTALSGRLDERPELAERAWDLRARVTALPCRGGAAILERLFAPLGYALEVTSIPLDAQHPEWGDAAHADVTLSATKTVKEMLSHLYVLVPVLDDEKHYYVGDAEIEKLLRRGEGWLAEHPERELITRRYLRHERRLTRDALARLAEGGPDADPDAALVRHEADEARLERPLSLDQARRDAVVALLAGAGARRVADLGCGEGRLLRDLLAQPGIERILGVDVSVRALERAGKRLRLDEMSPRQRERIELVHGSLTYRDRRLEGLDAAVAVEVIEHLDPSRLDAFARVLFGCMRPPLVVITTPNAEYNVHFESLPAGRFRHADHRFEWTRAQWREWAEAAAREHGYSFEPLGIGPSSDAGTPTQGGAFRRE